MTHSFPTRRASVLSARLHPLVDPTRSAALAGTEHIILPGDGPLLVLITNRRLPHFTHDGFIQYWLDYHGPFAREHTPPEVGLRYRQFHTDENATKDLLAADRKSVVEGKSVSVRVDLGGRRIIKKKKHKDTTRT